MGKVKKGMNGKFKGWNADKRKDMVIKNSGYRETIIVQNRRKIIYITFMSRKAVVQSILTYISIVNYK